MFVVVAAMWMNPFQNLSAMTMLASTHLFWECCDSVLESSVSFSLPGLTLQALTSSKWEWEARVVRWLLDRKRPFWEGHLHWCCDTIETPVSLKRPNRLPKYSPQTVPVIYRLPNASNFRAWTQFYLILPQPFHSFHFFESITTALWCQQWSMMDK